MPIVFQQDINQSSRLAVWQIQEPESFFAAGQSGLKMIAHPHRRLQHYCGRYLLSQLMPEHLTSQIQYEPNGKPSSTDPAFQFSIAHSGNQVAVIVSDGQSVGIDLEMISEKPFRLKEKFLGAGEWDVLLNGVGSRGILDNGGQQIDSFNLRRAATIGWTVKEAVFKWYGLGKVDFKDHIHIKSVIRHQNNSWEIGCHFLKTDQPALKIISIEMEGAILSYLNQS